MEEDESEVSEDKSLEPKDKTREHMDKKCIEHHARSLEPLCYWLRVFQAHIQMRQIETRILVYTFLKCFLNGVNNTQERMAIGKGQDECPRSSQECSSPIRTTFQVQCLGSGPFSRVQNTNDRIRIQIRP